MTDGVNGLADNGNDTSTSTGSSSANISDYSAYGYLGGSGSAPSTASLNMARGDGADHAADGPDDVLRRPGCWRPAPTPRRRDHGLYRAVLGEYLDDAGRAFAGDLSQCATTPSGALEAVNASALNTAFANIATSATAAPLHLTR